MLHGVQVEARGETTRPALHDDALERAREHRGRRVEQRRTVQPERRWARSIDEHVADECSERLRRIHTRHGLCARQRIVGHLALLLLAIARADDVPDGEHHGRDVPLARAVVFGALIVQRPRGDVAHEVCLAGGASADGAHAVFEQLLDLGGRPPVRFAVRHRAVELGGARVAVAGQVGRGVHHLLRAHHAAEMRRDHAWRPVAVF